VVDALVTDEDKSNYVILTRTIETTDDDPVRVTGATVIITDDLGSSTLLVEKSPGEYRTDSLAFRGAAGRTYTLSIETGSGEKYLSDPSLMYPVAGIDSIYFSKDQLLSGRNREMIPEFPFILIPVMKVPATITGGATKNGGNSRYPSPRCFDYINDSTILPVAELKADLLGK